MDLGIRGSNPGLKTGSNGLGKNIPGRDELAGIDPESGEYPDSGDAPISTKQVSFDRVFDAKSFLITSPF